MAEPMPGAVDDDAGVGFAAGDAATDQSGRHPGNRPDSAPSVPRSCTARPRPRRNATSVRRSATPVWSLAIATVRISAAGTSAVASADARPSIDDRDPPLSQRVLRQRRDVPALGQHHRLARRQHARVALGDDLKSFHCGMISPLWPNPTCVSLKSYSRKRRFKSASPRWPLEIRRDFPDDLHVIAVLKGAFIFLSDLVRHMPGPRVARLHGGLELRQRHDHAPVRCGC